MKSLVETSMKTYFRLRKYQIEFWKKNQKSSQEFLFFDLLQKSQNTEYGQKYSFDRIIDYKSFKNNIPIASYEDLAPFITRMIRGEKDILWPGTVCRFSKSSGTTNDVSKYIPVSHDALYQNNYKAGRDLYSIFFCSFPQSDLFINKGSMLSLGGSFDINEYGAKIGDVSAILMSEAPVWAESYRQPSIEVATMKVWKKKIPAIINNTIDKNITHLSGVPTWFLSIFEEMKKEHPYKNLRDIWPNLELFIHGAVAFGPYRNIFKKLLPFKDMKYLEVYNASEGFFAIQDDQTKLGEMLLLTDHGIFYEFISMSEYGNPNATAIMLKDVVVGVDYAMVISTNSGLWRYDIGDTVCFTSIAPYRIKISGRTKHFINVFGEELMVGNTEEAIEIVSKKYGVNIIHYSAGPIFMDEYGKGGHEWVIEFETSPKDISLFQKDLDQCLQSLNSDYKAKRQDDIALQELKIINAPENTFIHWMERRGKLGGQNKVPKLSNSRKYIDELIQIIN